MSDLLGLYSLKDESQYGMKKWLFMRLVRRSLRWGGRSARNDGGAKCSQW